MAGSDAPVSSGAAELESPPQRLPEWIRVRPPHGTDYRTVRDTVAGLGLGTVCQEARCPNLAECWSAGTATIMLLGTDCTRRCGFCAVTTHWPNGVVDRSEPERVAEGIARWGLRYAVLTQVCRDDLPDGGASVMAETVSAIRQKSPTTLVELLIGDLNGRDSDLATVLASRPDVLAHNLETVRALSDRVRDRRAAYDRSLAVLASAKRLGRPGLVTKSSIMLGLGERADELAEAFQDLREAKVDLLTLGQYLRPTPRHLPVAEYVRPEGFEVLRDRALAAGFSGVESGPLVRSSYHAEELYRAARAGAP
ncbi:MAG: lipoyl synthase [Thermoplasmata archaeon]|nr:lipoyl synthase [Thermoplasmata archaeon]